MATDNLLADYQLQEAFAKDYGISPRTVARYRGEPNGLPFAEFGGKIYIHIPGAREWLEARIRRAPRRRAA